MELTAKLVQILPLQTGAGKNGTNWKKQDVIVETDGQYPKKVCISIWGDKINENILKVGKMLTISFDVESREYNGKWYTDVKAWKVVEGGSSQDSQENDYSESKNIAPSLNVDDIEDLPF
jgi:hypothetical protein